MSRPTPEGRFKQDLAADLERIFPGCIILQGNSDKIQGITDWIVIWDKHWAGLEVKASRRAPHQPNQDWYVGTLNEMSFAAFIYPENKEEVLHALQSAWGSSWAARVSRR